ncbi:ABC transporter permease [Candidatus Parcubacteria bacterium]|nr:ABC transporter permease [Candidatus Parcubacteria bacterium]
MNKTLKEAWIIGKNEILIQMKNPLWLFFGLFQPIVYLTLFSPFLSGIAKAPGFPAESAIQFFVPGLLIMNILFGASFAGFGLINQLRSGYIERIRVTPVSRLAIVIGLVIRAPVVVLVQSFILVLTAMIFFGFHASFWGMHLEVLLMILIGLTMASVSYTIALIAKDEGTLAAITNFFTLPLMILSGIMLPVAFAPKIIQHISAIDPLRYAVDASRALVSGNVGDNAVAISFVLFALLAALALAWFIRSMKDAVS